MDDTRETNMEEEPTVIALEPADWSFDSSTGRGRFPAGLAGDRVRRGQLLRLEPRGQEPVLAKATMTRNGMVLVRQVEPDPTSAADAGSAVSSPSAGGYGQDAPRREPTPAQVECTDDHVDHAELEGDGAGAGSALTPDYVPVRPPMNAMDGSGARRREHAVSSQQRKPILETVAWKLTYGARLAGRALADGGAIVADRLARGSRRVRRGVKSTVQRVKRGWSDKDVWDLGHVTLVRLSGMMARLAATGYGYPAGYDEDRSKWLVRHEGEDYEKWLSSPARTVDRISADVEAGVCDHNKAFNETVSEYGVGASAWMQDLDHASKVLKEYAAGCDVERWSDDIDVYGREEADRRRKAREDEFQRTWEWIGEWLTAMWD